MVQASARRETPSASERVSCILTETGFEPYGMTFHFMQV